MLVPTVRPSEQDTTIARAELVPKSMPIVKGPDPFTPENDSFPATQTPGNVAKADQISTGSRRSADHAPPTNTGDTTSSTSGPVPAARARSRSACLAEIRTAFNARLAKLIMLRSIARVGSSRYVN